MNRFDRPDDLESQISDLERRMKIMETSARMPGFSNAAYADLENAVGLGGAAYRTSTGWGDPSILPATTVTVNVGPSGRVLVWLGSFIEVSESAAPAANVSAALNFKMTGANTAAASAIGRPAYFELVHDTTVTLITSGASVASFTQLTGLNTGDTVLTLQYYVSDTNPTVTFWQPWILAVPV